MRFLALATSDDGFFERLPADRSIALAAAEAARTWDLYRDGVIREMSWRADRADVVIVLEAADLGAARTVISTLPFVEAGGISFEIVGLRPYDGWQRLFDPDMEAPPKPDE